jgi:hypothetical protein
MRQGFNLDTHPNSLLLRPGGAEVLGPEDFRPSLPFCWFGLGENAVSARREELRKSARARMAAAG